MIIRWRKEVIDYVILDTDEYKDSEKVIITTKDFVRAMKVIRKSFSEDDMTDYTFWRTI